MTEVARTPDERFERLVGWPYQPRYSHIRAGGTALRLALVDEGPATAHPVVLLHGEPTWGYLYRNVLTPLVDAGLRTIVPDLVGFGRSDKPTDTAWYTYDHHCQSLAAHLDAAGVDRPVTLVVHDWGGPIGLRWAVEHPDRVARLVILDTLLYRSGWKPTKDWLRFRDYMARRDTAPAGFLVSRATSQPVSEGVRAAYDAPFDAPDAHAGALAFPAIVPLADDDPGATEMARVDEALADWQQPTLILWGADDAILPAAAGRRWAEIIPGCVGMDTIPGARHYLQEDAGAEIGRQIAAFVGG